MKFIDFVYYSFLFEQELFVEVELEYSPCDYINKSDSDVDSCYYNNYNILDLKVYYENGDEVQVTGHNKELSAGQIEQSSTGLACKSLNNEIRDKVNQCIRLSEIEDSRYDNLDIDSEFEKTYYNIAGD